MFERCIFSIGGTALVFFNGGDAQDRLVALMRNQTPPRPERAILGVASCFDVGWDKDPRTWIAYPYQVLMASHPLFAGAGVDDGQLIGASGRQGINGGGASGWEIDTSKAGNHGDDGVVVTAYLADDRGDPPAGLQLLARGTNPGPLGAEMTVYRADGGGLVFSAGSICFGGSLVQDAALQTVIDNALGAAFDRPRLVAVSLAPDTVVCGDSSTCTVTLDRPWPDGPVVVGLISGAPGFATVPEEVTIPAGYASADFTVATPDIAIAFKTAKAAIQASFGGDIVVADLTVKSRVVVGVLHSLTLSPTTVTGGESARGNVTLEQAVDTDTIVGLAAQEPGGGPGGPHGTPSSVASTPKSITIPAGSTSGGFTITTTDYLPPGTRRVAVIIAGAIVTLRATLTVTM
jgi:hypothetical protein